MLDFDENLYTIKDGGDVCLKNAPEAEKKKCKI